MRWPVLVEKPQTESLTSKMMLAVTMRPLSGSSRTRQKSLDVSKLLHTSAGIAYAER